MSDKGPWPVELRLKRAERRLDIEFDDGTRFGLPAEYLRVESPSAEVQGHGPGEKRIVAEREISSCRVESNSSGPLVTGQTRISSNFGSTVPSRRSGEAFMDCLRIGVVLSTQDRAMS